MIPRRWEDGLPTSYWLREGVLVFPYFTGSSNAPPWIIVIRGNRRKRIFGHSLPTHELIRFTELGYYSTEYDARMALHKYAMEKSLEPAY